MKKNILIINPDEMRADTMRHLGNNAAWTPNLDKLSQEGVSFSNAFCQNTVCVPSRCSFMTGLYPHTRGHRTMSHLLRGWEENIFLDMKQNGYYTVSNTRGDLMDGDDKKYHKACIDEYIKLGKPRKPFDRRMLMAKPDKDSDSYYSFLVGDGVIGKDTPDEIIDNLDDCTVAGTINSIKRRPKDKPFFMFVGLNAPHPEYYVEKKYYDLIDKSKLAPRHPSIKAEDNKPKMEQGLREVLRVGDWAEERLDEIRTVYLAMVAKIDDQIGQIIAALKEEGIYDDTAIIITSDHGDYAAEYGIVEKCQNCFPDVLCNVPFIVKPPKDVPCECGVNDNLIELVDLVATCWDIAGIDSGYRTQFGKSLLPMLKDKSLEQRQYVFCEGGRLPYEKFGVERTRPQSVYYARHSVEEREDGSHYKAIMVRSKEYKYIKRMGDTDEFYDLKVGEEKNTICGNENNPEIAKMKEALLEHLFATSDCLPQKADSRFMPEFMYNSLRMRGASKLALLIMKFKFEVLGQSPMDIMRKLI